MKLFFISDIHGSEYHLKKAMKRYEKEGAEYIVILGDILHHGATNYLSDYYRQEGVIKILNNYSDKIIAVMGNCDSEADVMRLDFPIESIYSNLIYNGKRLFLTHGHVYNENNMVELKEGSVFVYGHTHVLRAEKKENIYFLNPGSITLPRENNPHTYGILEGTLFQIKDLDGNIVKEIDLV